MLIDARARTATWPGTLMWTATLERPLTMLTPPIFMAPVVKCTVRLIMSVSVTSHSHVQAGHHLALDQCWFFH